jgi:hypothetical protein
MKEVQMNTSSLSLSLHPWFCNSCKYAFHAVEWITASPLLNFVLGNLIGFQRLMFKVWSYRASALYGAMHLMVFYLWLVKAHSQVRDYCMQNLDKQVKSCWENDYVDYGIRMAHAFSPNSCNQLYLSARYATNLTTKRTLEETEVMWIMTE